MKGRYPYVVVGDTSAAGRSPRFVPDTRGAPVLIDDLNPVDAWSAQTNFVARQDLHGYLREHGLVSY